MITRLRALRKPVAVATALVVTALTATVPLLDMGRDPNALAFSEPGAPAGFVDHDHDLCIQYSATAWSAPAAGAELPTERFIEGEPAPRTAIQRFRRTPNALHHSRAPPIV